MKKSILGFDQEKALKMGLELKDLIILRAVKDLIESNALIKREIDGQEFYWIKTRVILEAYPMLDIKTSDSVRRRLKKLVDKRFLTYKLVKENGTFTFYNKTNLLDKLFVYGERLDLACKKATDSKENKGNNKEAGDCDSNIGTNNNNKKHNNKKNKYKKDFAREVINYLNLALKTKYRENSKESLNKIGALVEEGFTLEDFKTVINKKKKDWSGTPYEKYLRPSTLFRKSNFEEYLNQVETKKKTVYKSVYKEADLSDWDD